MTASIAAGCGGTSPCTTERPASMGRPTRTSEVPVRRATVNAIGISSTKPTSKKAGKPTIAPPSSWPRARASRRKADQGVAQWSLPPPDSAIILPSIVPRATTMAMWPRVPPRPSFERVNDGGQRHARRHCQRKRDQKQAQERIQLEDGDEQNHATTAMSVEHQENGAVRIDHSRSCLPPHAELFESWAILARGRKRPARCPLVLPQCTTALRSPRPQRCLRGGADGSSKVAVSAIFSGSKSTRSAK